MPFPLAKLGYLAVKQLSKPLANFMKNRARKHAFFRDYVCIPVAQRYHSWDVNVKGRLAGLGKANAVKPLNPEMAVDLGAEMLGEVVIFVVASGTLYFEYWRQSRKDKFKENQQNESIDDLHEEIQHLGLVIEHQDTKIRELQRHIGFVPIVGVFPKRTTELTDKGTTTDVGIITGTFMKIKESLFG